MNFSLGATTSLKAMRKEALRKEQNGTSRASAGSPSCQDEEAFGKEYLRRSRREKERKWRANPGGKEETKVGTGRRSPENLTDLKSRKKQTSIEEKERAVIEGRTNLLGDYE